MLSALAEQATLLVVDNMESILLPPFLAEETPDALTEDARRELDTILKLCARLNAKGDTRIVFTSREVLPAPFDAQRNRRGQACEWFTQLDEPGSVAVVWHQTGMTYQAMDQPEAAEDAYRQSLVIKVRLGDVAGQARTLNQPGNLYMYVLDRPEEAAAFYRQAADKYVEIGNVAGEGHARGNLAITLRKLRRLDEARQEIRRVIECHAPFGHAVQPWTAWGILADIETDAGNPVAAAEAGAKAIACYLAYRRDGGENHSDSGRIILAVAQSLLAGDPASAASLLQQVAADPNLPSHARTFIRALQAIIAGSRDRALADIQDLDYMIAAEILFLIEMLEKAKG